MHMYTAETQEQICSSGKLTCMRKSDLE